MELRAVQSMTAIQPLTICGPVTSGKGTLAALLEGHPDVLAFPFWHDYLAPVIAYYLDKPVWRNTVHFGEKLASIIAIKQMLATYSRWQDLEAFSIQKIFPFTLSSTNFVNIPLDLDFYSLEKDLAERLLGLQQHDAEPLFACLYDTLGKAFYHSFKGASYPRPRWGVSLSSCGFNLFHLLAQAFPKGKTLYISRDSASAIASTVMREAHIKNMDFEAAATAYVTAYPVFIGRMIAAEKMAKLRAQSNPQEFLRISFDDLVQQTEKTMKQVCNWLSIEFGESLLTGSWLGKPFSTPVVGAIYDAPDRLLKPRQQEHLAELLASVPVSYPQGFEGSYCS